MFAQVHSALRLDNIWTANGNPRLTTIVEDDDDLGSFLLHHFLAASIKGQRKVLLIGLDQSLGHYIAVALKGGVNLQKARESGQLMAIEGLRSTCDAYSAPETSDVKNDFSFVTDPRRNDLTHLTSTVQDTIKRFRGNEEEGSRPVVIVDKLSLLLSHGVPVRTALGFCRRLQQICDELGADMVALTRRDPLDLDEDLNELTDYLACSSHLSVRCWPLESGKSSSVTGNMRFEWVDGDEIQSGRYQYCVEEKDVKVFALGASKAVL